MKNISRNFIVLFLVIIISLSCNEIKQKVFGVREGKITYGVKFSNLPTNGMESAALPDEVQIYFKKHLTRIEMSLAFGFIRTVSILDASKKTETILLDLFGKKYVLQNDSAAILTENNLNLKLEKSKEQKDIAGMKCKKILISDSARHNNFMVYYTDEIDAGELNWFTPYSEIHGMLMEYPLTRNGIDMELSAKKVEKQNIADSLFIIPEGYEIITREKFESIIDELMMKERKNL